MVILRGCRNSGTSCERVVEEDDVVWSIVDGDEVQREPPLTVLILMSYNYVRYFCRCLQITSVRSPLSELSPRTFYIEMSQSHFKSDSTMN